jgi:transcriptional regulator with XRE-family HTH domain
MARMRTRKRKPPPQRFKRGVGLNIKAERERRGLTQADLAKAAKVTQPCISQIESGRGLPSVALLNAIAGILNTTADKLLDGIFQKTA